METHAHLLSDLRPSQASTLWMGPQSLRDRQDHPTSHSQRVQQTGRTSRKMGRLLRRNRTVHPVAWDRYEMFCPDLGQLSEPFFVRLVYHIHTVDLGCHPVSLGCVMDLLDSMVETD